MRWKVVQRGKALELAFFVLFLQFDGFVTSEMFNIFSMRVGLVGLCLGGGVIDLCMENKGNKQWTELSARTFMM